MGLRTVSRQMIEESQLATSDQQEDHSPLWGESNVERGAAAGGSFMRRQFGGE